MGFVACLFSKLEQTRLRPCTLRCQDSPFANLRNKGCVFVSALGAGSGFGGLVLVRAEHERLGKLSPDRASCGQSQLSPSHRETA